jgi:hypothetical protein
LLKRARGEPDIQDMSRDQRPAHERRGEGAPVGDPSDRAIAEAAFGASASGARKDAGAPGERGGSAQGTDPVRLLVLLSILFFVSLAFLYVRTDTFSAEGPQATPGAFAPGCPGYHAPQATTVARHEIATLGAQLVSIPIPGSRVYESGMSVAEDAWSDDSPAALNTLKSGEGAAGYEVRWWTRARAGVEYDAAADVWQFPSVALAQAFAARAASPRCRPEAASGEALLQPGATVLTWVNPDHAAQWDVIFARGRRVYRAVVVPANYALHSGSLEHVELERRRARVAVQALACALPEAGCRSARGGNLS